MAKGFVCIKLKNFSFNFFRCCLIDEEAVALWLCQRISAQNDFN